MTNADGVAIEVWVIPEWGGIRWPDADWQFCDSCMTEFVNRVLRG